MAPGKKVAILGCGPVGERRALARDITLTCLYLAADTIQPTVPTPNPPIPLCPALLPYLAALLSSQAVCMGHIVTECPLPCGCGLAPLLRVPGLCSGAWLSRCCWALQSRHHL